ncbi:MAG TPA: galactokinase family protein, partial [Blastocatellia bacterium]|nr:galactokinase family protein [Blastocatellia bacterium]
MLATKSMHTEKLDQLAKALALFRQRYGAGEVLMARAPARINILGEHVDYVAYLPTASLPFASHEHEMVMVFRANNDGVVRGASLDERFAPFEFSLPPADEFQRQNWAEYLYNQPTPAPHWSNYVAGAVCFAQWKHGTQASRGFDFLVDSTIPACGGSSSSSALTCLAGAAVRKVNDLPFTSHE